MDLPKDPDNPGQTWFVPITPPPGQPEDPPLDRNPQPWEDADNGDDPTPPERSGIREIPLEKVETLGPREGDLGDRPSEAERPAEPGTLTRFVDDLATQAVQSTVWIAIEHIANVVAPGTGPLVQAAHIGARVVDAARTFLAGDGVNYTVSVLPIGEYSLDLRILLRDNDPGRVPSTSLDIDWDSLPSPQIPTPEGAHREPRDPKQSNPRPRYEVPPPADPDGIDVEYLIRCTRQGVTALVHLNPGTGIGWVDIDTGRGSPYCPLRFRARRVTPPDERSQRCARCGRPILDDAQTCRDCGAGT
jgi:hypothetical protein